MFNKLAQTTIILLAFFSPSTFAMPPKPDRCPSVTSIKSVGLSHFVQQQDHFIAGEIDPYGTKNMWMFLITDIHANSKRDMIKISYDLLDALYGNPEPLAVPSENLWACIYHTTTGHEAFAITPVDATAKLSVPQPVLLAAK